MINRAAIADYPAGSHLATRIIDDYELVWMLRGRATVTSPGREDRVISPGQLLLVPPGLAHGFAWDPDHPSRHGYVHFAGGRILEDRPRELGIRPMTAHDPLSGLCSYVLWLARTAPDGHEARLGETLRLLLTVFVSGPLPETERASPLPAALVASVDHLRHQWSGPTLRRIDVGELAGAAHVSRSQLNRLFRIGFERPPALAMELARLSRSEILLSRTDVGVETIGRRCGFADLSHFSHRFAAVHGIPPSAYRAAGSRAPSVLDDQGVRRLATLIWE